MLSGLVGEPNYDRTAPCKLVFVTASSQNAQKRALEVRFFQLACVFPPLFTCILTLFHKFFFRCFSPPFAFSVASRKHVVCTQAANKGTSGEPPRKRLRTDLAPCPSTGKPVAPSTSSASQTREFQMNGFIALVSVVQFMGLLLVSYFAIALKRCSSLCASFFGSTSWKYGFQNMVHHYRDSCLRIALVNVCLRALLRAYLEK